jgi:hypothetical protein
MVKHDPTANFRGRVDVHLEGDRHLVLQEDGQRAAAFVPQPVADAVSLKAWKPFRYSSGVEYLSTAGSRVRTAWISQAAEAIISGSAA